MLENPYYIYRHIRPDTNEVFYIGKGTNRRNSYNYERAKQDKRRSEFWNRVVNKNDGDYLVEIVMEFSCPEECSEKEKEFISIYGRKDLSKGTLVNLTDGGDGSHGITVSEETIEKRRQSNSGENHPFYKKKLSKEHRRKLSLAKQGEKHNFYGKKLSKTHVENIAKAKVGDKNPMFNKIGFDHPSETIVLNMETGIYYGSVIESAKAHGVNPKTLYQYLNGSRINKTKLVKV